MNEMKEDVYFYLDLTKDILKKKEIIKTIKFYIEEKNKVNIKGHYSLLIFQEEGNPIFITHKKDSNIIAKSIEENWKLRTKQQSFFENGLFYIFSFIAETVRKKSKFNRIILITDTPSDLSEGYQEALFNLVSKIKNFPTFIDVIRVSDKDERFFSDDVKLNMLASDTKGGIFYIKDKKEFLNVIKKLVRTKQFVSTFESQPDRIKISKDDYAFYNNLAKSLKKPESADGLTCHFCNEEICPVCTDIYDIPLLCEDCNTSFHNCCITNFTLTSHIGIPNIFRCPNDKCDVLLKLEEEEVEEISGEVEVDFEEVSVEKGVVGKIPENISEQLKSSMSTSIEKESEYGPPDVGDYGEGEYIKTIRIGGFFGKVYHVIKKDNKIVYSRSSTTTFKPKAPKNQTGSKTVLQTTNEKRKKKPSFVICQQCGSQINTASQNKCQTCGYKI